MIATNRSRSCFQLTGSQESMLRVEQDDPFSDIFYFGPDTHVSTIVETSTIVVSYFSPNFRIHEGDKNSFRISEVFCKYPYDAYLVARRLTLEESRN